MKPTGVPAKFIKFRPEADFLYYAYPGLSKEDFLRNPPCWEEYLPLTQGRGTDGQLHTWLYATGRPVLYDGMELPHATEITRAEFDALVAETRQWYGRYLDVEGVPVEVLVDERGAPRGAVAHDVEPPRPFRLSAAWRNGAILNRREFAELVRRARRS